MLTVAAESTKIQLTELCVINHPLAHQYTKRLWASSGQASLLD